MPNTLAHLGVQGALLGRVARRDLAWVAAGAALPDLPWIVHRVLKRGGIALGVIDLDRVTEGLYDLRLYAIVQATLLFCLILAAGIAMLSARPPRVFGVLAASSLVHLLLDATQTRWGNGVHLLAPVSWRETALQWYWPESPVTLAMTGLGLVVAGWVWRATARGRPRAVLARSPGAARIGGAGLLLGVWALAPLALLGSAEAADVHYIRTLRDREARAGRPIELHRAFYRPGKRGPVVRTMIEEELLVDASRGGAELVRALPEPARISVRGRFLSADRIAVESWHRHRAGVRDAASYVGLVLVAALWSTAAWGGRRAAALNRRGTRAQRGNRPRDAARGAE